MNAGNYEESKRLYKIIIQGGPEKIAEVDENKIIYRENFSRIKNELIAEYEEIAERIYKTESVEKVEDCADRVTQEKSLSSLKHALNLLNYSRSIGGTNTLLYEKITTAIEKGEKTVEENKGKCQ
jgi:predicted ThiF/HesA family dinucleotide-utilizing enzyme